MYNKVKKEFQLYELITTDLLQAAALTLVPTLASSLTLRYRYSFASRYR